MSKLGHNIMFSYHFSLQNKTSEYTIIGLNIYTINPLTQMESRKVYSSRFPSYLSYSSKYSSKSLHLEEKITAAAHLGNYADKSNSPGRGKYIIKQASIFIRISLRVSYTVFMTISLFVKLG